MNSSTRSQSSAARTYSTAEVAQLSGASLRQLQHWDETGIASPVHIQHRHQYKPMEAALCALAMELRKRGISMHSASRILARIRRNPSFLDLCEGLPDELFFLTNKRGETMLAGSARDAVKLLAERKGDWFLIDVGEVARRISH